MLLAVQRKDVVRATLVVPGNEYYQLGDVVYVNSRDMLYYVYGISHSFSYSGSFQTTLDLRYGHPLGEFIPTPLDVIGKNLIKNQRKFNETFMFRSTSNVDTGRCVGTVLFKLPDGASTTTTKDVKRTMLQGDIGVANLLELKNALLRINIHRDSQTFKEVEIRGFIRNDNKTDRERVQKRMEAVKEWLGRPASIDSDGEEVKLNESIYIPISASIIKDFDFGSADSADPVLIPKDKTTDLKEKHKGRTPSEESYNLMIDPTDSDGESNVAEFNTIEIIITFEK